MSQMLDMLWCSPPGWDGLLGEFHQRALEVDPQYHCEDIREKWGALRLSLTPDPSLIAGKPCDHAEYDRRWWTLFTEVMDPIKEASKTVCALCGAPGRQVTVNRWVSVQCGNH